MANIYDSELNRQFNNIRQEIDIHSSLRDSLYIKGLVIDLSLLALSVILCGTTFFSKDNLTAFGIESLYPYLETVKAFTAIFLLAFSICALRVDFKERSTIHRDAVGKLTQLIGLYRMVYDKESDTWPSDKREELHNTYWKIHDCIAPIPSSKFNSLKAKYRRKVEISKLLDLYPHCPIWLMKISLSCRYAVTYLRTKTPNIKE